MNRMKPYQWLYFDADGTLFDYDLAEASALQNAFRAFDLPYDANVMTQYHAINHQLWLEFEQGQVSAAVLRTRRFERLFTALGMPTAADGFSQRYLQELARGTQLIRGAEAVIRGLRARYHLAIITNGFQEVQRPRLAHSTIADCFEATIVSEEIGFAKPDARFFEAAFAQTGQPERSTVLVIGDSLTSDILGGIQAGLDTCWFNPSAKPPRADILPTYQVRQLDDVLPLLNGQTAA